MQLQVEKEPTYLVIDAGNTRIKAGIFSGNAMNAKYFSKENQAELKAFLQESRHDHAVLSSVLSDEETTSLLGQIRGCRLLKDLSFPILNAYQSPETLGADRLANAVAALCKIPGNRLVIDIGTCIKFDLVDAGDSYRGGSISPGIRMRYHALHDYTGKLPLLEHDGKRIYLGDSTESSIHAGVLSGAQEEINGFIRYYEANYPGLTIFVTGGDYLYFDYSAKNNIFVDENLTLFGLLQILKANVQ